MERRECRQEFQRQCRGRYRGNSRRQCGTQRSRSWPLRLSPEPGCPARRHAEDIGARATLDHVGADGTTLGVRLWCGGYRYTRAAENRAQAGADPREVVALWAESPRHRRNMLNGGLTEAGVAGYATANGLIG